MLVRLRGWGDADVLALLALFRKHIMHYVYAADQFAGVVHAELPDKTEEEILEMVRSLMQQFGLRFSTKNFRTDVIVVANGQEVYVYEHIYESVRLLPENKAGGVWLPDELSRFLQKAKQYRKHFTDNQEQYFKRIQFWGKSIAEAKSKFYALRDVYMKEKRRPHERVGVQATRLELLKDIFTDVPPFRRTEQVVVPNKSPKLWSAEQMETLLDYLVRITVQIQKTGSSDLVDHVAEALYRTDGSCVNKLADMRLKFLTKSSTVRAANLPDSIFDPNSEAHKIFCADWSDINDPYALGFLALKSRSLRIYSELNRKRRSKSIWSARPKLRSKTLASRGAGSSSTKSKSKGPSTQGAAPLATTPTSTTESRNIAEVAVPQPASSARTSATMLRENVYSAFVRDIAVQCRWTENVVLNVLRCMQHSIDLYRSNKLVDFYYKIAGLTQDVTFQDLFADGQHILTQFKQRFGTLDGFESLNLTTPDINSPIACIDQETKEQGHGLDSEVSSVVNTTVDENASISRNSGVIVDQDEHGQSPASVLQNSFVNSEDFSGDGHPGSSNVSNAKDLISSVKSPVLQNSPINSEDFSGDEYRGRLQQSAQTPQTGTARQEQSSLLESEVRTPPTGNMDAVNDHRQEQYPLLESPSQTPQTGNEDTADGHSLNTIWKQSSPDAWDDADADLDDDDLDNHSVGSSDNAWSGSSNVSNTKDSEHHSKDNSALNSPYRFASDSSKKPSKRGKDEQYGKNFEMAKKRRLNQKNTAVNNDDGEDEEDGGYDEGEDDDDDQSDEEPPGDIDTMSSDGEIEEAPHPLQSILNSLESHMAELQEKQRILIERKADREWRQRHYGDREYGVQMSLQSFASESTLVCVLSAGKSFWPPLQDVM